MNNFLRGFRICEQQFTITGIDFFGVWSWLPKFKTCQRSSTKWRVSSPISSQEPTKKWHRIHHSLKRVNRSRQRFSNRSRGNSTSKYFDSTCHRFVYLLGVKYFISTCVAWVTLKTLASAKWSVLGRSRSKMCVCEHNLGGPSLSRCTALHNPVAMIAKATGKTRYAFTDTLYLDGHLISSTFMRQQQLQNCCCSKWLLRFGTLAWCLSVLWCRYFWVLIVNILTVTHVLKWQSPARNGSGVFFGTVQRFRAMSTSPSAVVVYYLIQLILVLEMKWWCTGRVIPFGHER